MTKGKESGLEKLIELLNKLIKKGRVPFGDKRITNISWKMQYVGTYNWVFWSNHNVVQFWKSTRELVSKESGLWQFVCESGMVKHEIYEDIQSWEHTTAEHSDFWYTSGDNYEYRLIESALTDEDKLKDFILENIVIKDEK